MNEETAMRRIGRKMALVAEMARRDGGVAVIDVARRVGPHGSLMYGYQTVRRTVKSGLVRYAPPLPGRRGLSIVAV